MVEHKKESYHLNDEWEVVSAHYGPFSHNLIGRLDEALQEDPTLLDNASAFVAGFFDPSQSFNVTDAVRKRLSINKSIQATNIHFGDPSRGHKKILLLILRQEKIYYNEMQGTSWLRTWSYQYRQHYYYDPTTRATSWNFPSASDRTDEVSVSSDEAEIFPPKRQRLEIIDVECDNVTTESRLVVPRESRRMLDELQEADHGSAGTDTESH